jgi:hypothetical protein
VNDSPIDFETVDLASIDDRHHAVELLPRFAARRAHVVVDELTGDGPTARSDEPQQIFALSVDTQLLAGPVLRLSEVDRFTHAGIVAKHVGCWGPEASEFAKSTLLGQRVAFVTDPSQGMYDRFGRTNLGLLRQGRRMGLLGRSGPRGCGPFLRLSRPSLGPSRRDCSCRTGSEGRWPGPVGTAVLRPNDVSPNLIRRGAFAQRSGRALGPVSGR